MDWFDLLTVQGTLKSLLQHHSSKASIQKQTYCLTVQDTKCWWDPVLSEAPGEGVVQGLSLPFLQPQASIGSQIITPVLCPHVVFTLCVFTAFPSVYVCFCVQISPLYNDAIHVGLGPTLMPLF